MDFDLSDDQVALRDTARELLADLAAPARVRAFSETDAAYDPHLWAAIAEQGWLHVDASEAAGGLGFGTVEVAVLLETLGGHAAPVPYRSTMLATALLEAAEAGGAAALRDEALVACVAWSRRPDAVRATSAGGAWTLTGRPDPTLDAPAASLALVVALDDADQPGVFAVDLGPDGAMAAPDAEPAMDITRRLGWLRFDATPARRVGGADVVESLVDRGALYTSAEMLGGAQRVLDLSVAYAKDRVQFGKPIGSFQAVKHRCADMLVDVEGMRSSTYWAAWAIGADDPDASVAASTAKVWGSDASKRVMASSLQVHGGIGFTWEHDLHFFLKRAQLDQLAFGDAAHHRTRLAALLRERVDAGLSVV
jgi:alkylation response protein AidB-like acyl-CoA dehydrogenase